MPQPTFLEPTPSGDRDVDRVVMTCLNLLELFRPGSLVAAYLQGSHALGEAVSTSDVDLLVVHHNEGDDLEMLRRVRWCATGLSTVLDLNLQQVQALPSWSITDHDRLLWGTELRPLPPVDVETFAASRMHLAWAMVTRGRGHLGRPVTGLPLDYPDPDGAVKGYDFRTLHTADGEVPSIKELVVASGWIASALLALDHGEVVLAKSACVAAYEAHIGGRWAPWLRRVHDLVRGRWAYLVPDDPADRASLAELLPDMLAFEQAFAERYLAWCRSRPDDPEAVEALAAFA